MSLIRKIYNLFYLKNEAWKSANELVELQNNKLRSMIDYACINIPYYEDIYKSLQLDKYPVLTVQDLERLPIITKEDIQKRPEDFVRPGADISQCLEMHTSGSTGMPLKIYYGEKDDDFSKVNNLRSFIEAGYKWGDSFVTISDPDWVANRYHRKNSAGLQQRLNVFNPIDVNMRNSPSQIVDDIIKIGKCDVLYGYPTNIFLVAKEVERRGSKVIKPRIVVTNGELLEPRMREYINNVFDTKLYDFYTTEEFKRIAWECEQHEGYHIDMESVVLEFVKDGKQVPKGERGEIIITSLYNYTMPLIRYRQGDIGIESTDVCACGRGLKLMKALEGRTDNFIINKKNELFSPQIFWSIFRHYFSMKKYQILQDSTGCIKVLYCKNPESNSLERDIQEIEEKIKESLGYEMNIDFEEIESFGPGKRKSVSSKLKPSLY